MIRILAIDEIGMILPLSAQVQAIHAAEHPEQYCAEVPEAVARMFFEEKIRDGAQLFVAEDDAGAVCGFLLAVPNRREGNPFVHASALVELDQICVDERCRGQGIGAALIGAMEHWMQKEGFGEWRAVVHDFNAHSQNLMRGQGANVLAFRFQKTLAP
ncbi:GNAT family N-acetyltransferase [Shimia sp. MMG029]|uniref:GNAT family N-acetyltransferase n=1 Tax=Shimia sp. MMG029 TaxID=3021978 RepID=UPI0022FDFB7B|nr:GNAT family N-acetyltransferase [Shimia sp. MMG029]MDA5558120.1 GNAT family N-acetyltransferase [Shimia sp. MMG029]